jgi:hypothetical protein
MSMILSVFDVLEMLAIAGTVGLVVGFMFGCLCKR